jgi:hypothetical protein
LPPREALPPAQPPEFKPFVLPADSGLVMVETSASKVASDANPHPFDQPAPQPGPRRARPPRPVIPEEPLVMVETTHKD